MMKFKPVSLLLLLASTHLGAQNMVQWSDSMVVSTTPQPITAPRITILKDGTPLATWGVSGNAATTTSQIWCSRFENGVFSNPVGVVESPLQPSLFGFGGYDVAASDSQIFVVFEQTQQGIFICRSEDGGHSFSAPDLVQGTIPGGYVTLASVAIDGTGNPVVSYIRDKNGASYQVRSSTDGGLSFQDPVTASAPSAGDAVCECCSSDIQTSGDSVWLLYRNNNLDTRDIWISRSTDLAATFDLATDVDSTDWQLNFCPIAGPRMTRSGDSLMTVWMSSASGIGRVYLSSLHAGTMQAGQQLLFPNSSPLIAQSLPDVAAHGDTLGVVYLEKAKEILFHYSVDGAAGLIHQSKRFAVPNHTLQYPSIAFQDGIFHLIYSDATADKVFYRQGRLVPISPTQEPPNRWNIVASPNPTTGPLHVTAGDAPLLEVQLMDAQGRLIESWKKPAASTHTFSIDLGSKPAGVYFVRLSTPEHLHFVRIIKN